MDIVLQLQALLLSLGTAWVLWSLLALSAASVAVMAERWLAFRAKGAEITSLAEWLDGVLAEGSITEALERLDGERSLAARISAAGLRLAPHGPEAAQRAMESAEAVERSFLERRLVFLGTLGNNAPFIGLFGTVIGVILAFDALGAETAAATNQAASAAVMSAIAEALVATAVGIAVALPAVAANNYFQRRITGMLDEAEALSKLVLAYLSSREREPAGGHRQRESA